MKTVKFNITGMGCASCKARIINSVEKLYGVKSVNVNLLLNTMITEIDENKIKKEDIIEAVINAGYGAYIDNQDENKSNFRQEWERKQKITEDIERNMKKRLLISVILLILLFFTAIGHRLNINILFLAFLQMLITALIIFINRQIFISGIKALIKGAANMDSLVATGAGISFLYGTIAICIMVYSVYTGDKSLFKSYSNMLYFESSAGILTFITIGKYLESRSKTKTSYALQKLIDLTPKTAVVIRNGAETVIPAENVEINDIVLIKAGETIPVDGIIIDGSAWVNQSSVTGESIPVSKNKGDSVICATVNENGFLKVKALNTGENTTLYKIIKLVNEAGNSKTNSGSLADKISSVFVPLIFCISILTLIIWLLAGKSIEFALNCAVCVLVISCPCALGLAAPVSVTVGTGRAAQFGILVKSAENFEKLCSIDTVVLDKTGTVTEGKPEVTDIDIFSKDTDRTDFLSVIAGIESRSSHPIAKALIDKAKSENIAVIEPDEFENYPGLGVSAKIGRDYYFIGNYEFINKQNINYADKEILEKYSKEGKSTVIIAKNNNVTGIIAAEDKIKETAKETVNVFHKMGLKVVLLTGDNELSAKSAAGKLNIDNVFSGVLPNQKSDVIKNLQDKGCKIVMVGDGINDSLALTRADTGIAIGAGSDIAIDCADIILMKNSLQDIITAIKLSCELKNNIKINLFWAFFYNIIGIPIAAGILYPAYGVLLSPVFAAAAMSFSSICVVMNALRLRFFKENNEKG